MAKYATTEQVFTCLCGVRCAEREMINMRPAHDSVTIDPGGVFYCPNCEELLARKALIVGDDDQLTEVLVSCQYSDLEVLARCRS